MTHEARMSRREFLATTAAGAVAGGTLCQQPTEGSPEPLQRCALSEIPTGFQKIDNLTGGFHRSELGLLASRPGVGKTALALNFADFVSVEAGFPTLYFTLGTSRVEIAQRLMCSRGGVCHSAMSDRKLSSDVGQRLVNVATAHKQGHMYVDDQPLRTVTDVRLLAQQLNHRLAPHSKLGVLVVDHLQRVEAEYDGQTLDEHLIDVAYELRTLAKELNVAVLALMQLGCPRSVSRQNTPALSELSGTQYAANTVMFLHRPGFGAASGHDEKGEIETEALLSVIRRQQRLSDTVRLSFNAQYVRFREADLHGEESHSAVT
jgi:replicative DNA helicase